MADKSLGEVAIEVSALEVTADKLEARFQSLQSFAGRLNGTLQRIEASLDPSEWERKLSRVKGDNDELKSRLERALSILDPDRENGWDDDRD